MNGVPNLTAAEQQEFQQRMEAKSFKLAISAFNKLTDQCFVTCVSDFSSKSLGSREEDCIVKCFEKFNNGQARIGARFQENMAALMGGDSS